MVKKLQIYFQVSNYKGRNFLYINDNNSNSICPTYSKDGAWLKYKQRFFPNSSITYPCGSSSIETRLHILYDYKQYKKSWNSKQEFSKMFSLSSSLIQAYFAFKKTVYKVCFSYHIKSFS